MAWFVVCLAAAAAVALAASRAQGFECPQQKTQSLIVDPDDCRKYYHCLPDGRVFPMQCPNGLVFDTRQKVCMWDSNARSCAPDYQLEPIQAWQPPDTDTTHKDSSPNQPRRGKSDRSRRNKPQKQKKAPVSSRSKKLKAKAAPTKRPSSHWTKRTDRRHNAQTRSSTTARRSTRPPTTTAKLTTSTTTTNTATTTVPTSAPAAVTVAVDDERSGERDEKVNYMGDVLASLGFGVQTSPLVQGEGTSDVTGQDENKEATTADHSGSYVESGPSNLEEQPHSLKKRSPEDNMVWDSVHCPSGYAYVPDPSNCAVFYHCYNWQPMKKRCPPGLFFDHQTYVCNWPHNVNCIEGYRAKTLFSFNEMRSSKRKTSRPRPVRTTTTSTTTTTTTTTTTPQPTTSATTTTVKPTSRLTTTATTDAVTSVPTEVQREVTGTDYSHVPSENEVTADNATDTNDLGEVVVPKQGLDSSGRDLSGSKAPAKTTTNSVPSQSYSSVLNQSQNSVYSQSENHAHDVPDQPRSIDLSVPKHPQTDDRSVQHQSQSDIHFSYSISPSQRSENSHLVQSPHPTHFLDRSTENQTAYTYLQTEDRNPHSSNIVPEPYAGAVKNITEAEKAELEATAVTTTVGATTSTITDKAATDISDPASTGTDNRLNNSNTTATVEPSSHTTADVSLNTSASSVSTSRERLNDTGIENGRVPDLVPSSPSTPSPSQDQSSTITEQTEAESELSTGTADELLKAEPTASLTKTQTGQRTSLSTAGTEQPTGTTTHAGQTSSQSTAQPSQRTSQPAGQTDSATPLHSRKPQAAFPAARYPFYAMRDRRQWSGMSSNKASHPASTSAFGRGSRLRAGTRVSHDRFAQSSPVWKSSSQHAHLSLSSPARRAGTATRTDRPGDVQIEKFMIKLLNDAMKSKHVVPRDAERNPADGKNSQVDKVTVTPGHITNGPRGGHDTEGSTAAEPRTTKAQTGSDSRHVQTSAAPVVGVSRSDDATTTKNGQDMRVSGKVITDMTASIPSPATYVSNIDPSQVKSLKRQGLSSFPLSAAQLDEDGSDNLILTNIQTDPLLDKGLLRDLKGKKKAMDGMLDKQSLSPTNSLIDEELDYSGDIDSDRDVPKIQAFSALVDGHLAGVSSELDSDSPPHEASPQEEDVNGNMKGTTEEVKKSTAEQPAAANQSDSGVQSDDTVKPLSQDTTKAHTNSPVIASSTQVSNASTAHTSTASPKQTTETITGHAPNAETTSSTQAQESTQSTSTDSNATTPQPAVSTASTIDKRQESGCNTTHCAVNSTKDGTNNNETVAEQMTADTTPSMLSTTSDSHTVSPSSEVKSSTLQVETYIAKDALKLRDQSNHDNRSDAEAISDNAIQEATTGEWEAHEIKNELDGAMSKLEGNDSGETDSKHKSENTPLSPKEGADHDTDQVMSDRADLASTAGANSTADFNNTKSPSDRTPNTEKPVTIVLQENILQHNSTNTTTDSSEDHQFEDDSRVISSSEPTVQKDLTTTQNTDSLATFSQTEMNAPKVADKPKNSSVVLSSAGAVSSSSLSDTDDQIANVTASSVNTDQISNVTSDSPKDADGEAGRTTTSSVSKVTVANTTRSMDNNDSEIANNTSPANTKENVTSEQKDQGATTVSSVKEPEVSVQNDSPSTTVAVNESGIDSPAAVPFSAELVNDTSGGENVVQTLTANSTSAPDAMSSKNPETKNNTTALPTTTTATTTAAATTAAATTTTTTTTTTTATTTTTTATTETQTTQAASSAATASTSESATKTPENETTTLANSGASRSVLEESDQMPVAYLSEDAQSDAHNIMDDAAHDGAGKGDALSLVPAKTVAETGENKRTEDMIDGTNGTTTTTSEKAELTPVDTLSTQTASTNMNSSSTTVPPNNSDFTSEVVSESRSNATTSSSLANISTTTDAPYTSTLHSEEGDRASEHGLNEEHTAAESDTATHEDPLKPDNDTTNEKRKDETEEKPSASKESVGSSASQDGSSQTVVANSELTTRIATSDAQNADLSYTDNVRAKTGNDDTTGSGSSTSKRSFVSLTDLITWYLKHWRNYAKWRQDQTTTDTF